ncbi:four helix bundle protein [Patescibacteria group bacterium]|nr:four helix bundle protein [Patescibacteria group bacterium]
MYVKNVNELRIYQLALELAKETSNLIKQIPHYWDIEECRQILRSSSSCSSNIAEGFSQRSYVKKFINYLNIAMGSSDESQDHLTKLRNNKHITSEIAEDYIFRYKSLSVKTLNMINHLKNRSTIAPQ